MRGDRVKYTNRSNKSAIGILISVGLLVTLSFNFPIAAHADTISLPGGTVIFFSPESQESYHGEPILDRATATLPSIQTRLNPATIGLCNTGFGDIVVSSFTSKFDGAINLKCGDSASGYIHIRANHQPQWQAQMTGPGLWDDYMVWASRQALSAPLVALTQSGNKRCYTTPIRLYQVVNGVSSYWKTINPSVVVSMNNKILITSIPSTTSTC